MCINPASQGRFYVWLEYMARKKKKPLKASKAPKKPAHRPTSWKKEYNDAIVKFFSEEPLRLFFDKVNKPHLVANKPPTFEKFADKIGVCVDSMNEWQKEENKKKYPGFSESYARAKQLQKDFLMAIGSTNAGNASFCIFMLKNNHGMRDKTEVDQNVKIDNLQDVINQAYEQADNSGNAKDMAE